MDFDLSSIERHLNTLASLGVLVSAVWFLIKERDVYKRMKMYINEMYFNYCGERQKLYVPVDNGAEPIVPPLPRSFSQTAQVRRDDQSRYRPDGENN